VPKKTHERDATFERARAIAARVVARNQRLSDMFQAYEPKPFPESTYRAPQPMSNGKLKALHMRLYNAQNGTCAGCGLGMVLHDVTVDHVDPTSRGGSDDIRNKVAMHSKCNGAKGDRMPNGCDLIWRQAANAGVGLYFEDLAIKATGTESAPSALALALMGALTKTQAAALQARRPK